MNIALKAMAMVVLNQMHAKAITATGEIFRLALLCALSDVYGVCLLWAIACVDPM